MTILRFSLALIVLSLICLIQTNCFITVTVPVEVNNRPIIGILSQEISYRLQNIYPNEYDSYIAASYVKFLESAGARIVPIWIGQNDTYYEEILSKINGVLFPGGNTYFNQSKGFADAGTIIYKIATEMNERGDYFPIWGTCLGFELIMYIAAGNEEIRTECNSNNVALPLEFKEDFMNSRMFKNASSDIINILRDKKVTVNFHKYCVTEEGLDEAKLTDTYRVISLNKDVNDKIFISTVEHSKLPFYGTQFHPEKNNFEWSKQLLGIPHTSDAVKVSQFFSNFFVNEARKNQHVFESDYEEAQYLIYNYIPIYTGLKTSFEQCYLFKKITNKE